MLYKDFAPTGFDRRGQLLDDQQDWVVVPVLVTRESDCLPRSNFEVALELLGGESDMVQVHRFGHWAYGWFEIIVVHPSLQEQVQEIEAALENYPILNEAHYSQLEWDTAHGVWEQMSFRERIDACKAHGVSIFAARGDVLPNGIDISRFLQP